jgi:hypothetical protein
MLPTLPKEVDGREVLPLLALPLLALHPSPIQPVLDERILFIETNETVGV